MPRQCEKTTAGEIEPSDKEGHLHNDQLRAMQRVRDWVDSFPPKLKRKKPNVRHFGNKTVSANPLANNRTSVDRNGNPISDFQPQLSLSVCALDYSRNCVLCSPAADTNGNGNLRRPCQCQPPSDRSTSSLIQPYSMPKTCCKASEFDQVTIPIPHQRPKIRTNPWVSPRATVKSEVNFSPRSPTNIVRPNHLRRTDPADSGTSGSLELPMGKLDESLCASESSGYASNDSSPETSIHSPDWQKAADSHSSTDVAIADEIQTETQPLPNLFIKIAEDLKANAVGSDSNDLLTTSDELDQSSGDLLEQLSNRLLNLSIRGRTVQQLMDLAKFEHQSRLKTKRLCMEQLAALREMKLMIHSGFEMVI